MDYVEPPPPWEEGRQDILNALEAQMPQHTFKTPVPVVVRIVWEHDGEEQIETVALGWTGQHVYIRLPDPRYRSRGPCHPEESRRVTEGRSASMVPAD